MGYPGRRADLEAGHRQQLGLLLRGIPQRRGHRQGGQGHLLLRPLGRAPTWRRSTKSGRSTGRATSVADGLRWPGGQPGRESSTMRPARASRIPARGSRRPACSPPTPARSPPRQQKGATAESGLRGQAGALVLQARRRRRQGRGEHRRRARRDRRHLFRRRYLGRLRLSQGIGRRGRHTLRITVLGQHGPRANDSTVAIDGFRVEP